MPSSPEVPYSEAGRAPDFCRYQKEVSYLDELETIWGKRWGAQGIGKLREVAVWKAYPIELEPFPTQYPFMPAITERDLEAMLEQHANMVSFYQASGIRVHFQDLPPDATNAYGTRLESNFPFAATMFVINGGAIIAREGQPSWRGKSRLDARFLMSIGCPILYTIHGTGVGEVGAFTRMTDDFIVVMLSTDCNREGLDQIRPILERSGYREIHASHNPGPVEHYHEDFLNCAHSDCWITPVDVRLALIYPRWCDFETVRKLRDLGYELIEVPEEEVRRASVCNSLTLEPGHVLMPEGADETARVLSKKGVEVSRIPVDAIEKFGGGIRCTTAQLVRDPGPRLFD